MKVSRQIFGAVLVSTLAMPAFGAKSVMQCFFECKTNATGSRLVETTTLMITNENQPAVEGDHSNTHLAHLVFIDGRENVIAQGRLLLSPRDLDEVNVCATLGRDRAPSAGLVHIAVTPLTTTPVMVDDHGISAWMKNVIGRFSHSNPEPFEQRVTGVGKTHCRYLDEDVVKADQLLEDPAVAQAFPVDPVLIEKTEDPQDF